jgi:heat-inducible transcriptional repressor
MTQDNHLSHRESGILGAIVQAYLDTGEPVASLALARLRGMSLSAATIRNVMADLTDQGLLCQPHTSAGRIPTTRAIQLYVGTLAVRLVSAELAQMRAELARLQTVGERVERSSQILTKLTHNVGIVAALPVDSRVLSHVELVALPANKLLMVVVSEDGQVWNQLVELDTELTAVELTSIRNYLNVEFRGWRLPDVRLEIERRLQLESAAYDTVLRGLMELHVRGLLDLAIETEVRLGGTSNLLAMDLHLTREALRDLFRTLEEKKRVLSLLDRFVEQHLDAPGVRVGLSEIHPAMEHLSLVGVTVHQPNGLSTRVAVLGPMRMDYARALSAVTQMQHALQSLPA